MGGNAAGKLALRQAGPNDVEVSGKLTGLVAGTYTLHLHAPKGCSVPPQMGDDADSHLKNLGVITADASGTADIRLAIPDARIGGMKPITGACLVLFQPDPAAGYLASGVILTGGLGLAPH